MVSDGDARARRDAGWRAAPATVSAALAACAVALLGAGSVEAKPALDLGDAHALGRRAASHLAGKQRAWQGRGVARNHAVDRRPGKRRGHGHRTKPRQGAKPRPAAPPAGPPPVAPGTGAGAPLELGPPAPVDGRNLGVAVVAPPPQQGFAPGPPTGEAPSSPSVADPEPPAGDPATPPVDKPGEPEEPSEPAPGEPAPGDPGTPPGEGPAGAPGEEPNEPAAGDPGTADTEEPRTPPDAGAPDLPAADPEPPAAADPEPPAAADLEPPAAADPEPPAAADPEPPPPAAPSPLFEGRAIRDFALVQAARGAITEVPDPLGGGETVFRLTVRDSDVAPITPTENPRAQLLSPALIEAGDELWLKTRFLVPQDFPTVNGWLTLVEIHGPPFAGSSPWQVEIVGDRLQWTRNRTYGYDVPWQTPLRKGVWVNLLLHERFAADGFVEMWIDGQPVSFFGRETRLAMKTMDATNGGGANSAKIMSYRKAGMFETATVYFGPLLLGPTRAAVVG